MSKETMKKAYRVADELLKERLRQTAPDAAEELERIESADVIVTRGQYDHIEDVFKLGNTPHTLVSPHQLNRAALRPDQIVFVNCPGNVPARGLRKLAGFVAEGGFLFTTDWALKHVLEPAFPGYVEFNQKPTKDEVVRVEVLDRDDPFLASILGPEDDPQWWLESSSYPIRILAADKVDVLVTSKELRELHGESPVFLTFAHGEGRVYHMISHFYLQRVETRTRRHRRTSADYLLEKGISEEAMESFAALGLSDVNLGQVEAAYTSRGMLARVLLERMRRKKRAAVDAAPGDSPKTTPEAEA
ncbi:MAG: hypothetical protein JSW67_05575 [Candidatus Latescibacterota bacterium]|nr:MAG: hypothetical protein JSW67_05575 [Candidatus Latescibacterota bacterium]